MRTKDPHKETAILEAGIIVFAESGFHAARIHRIAELAGIASGSVYSYYDNKLEILLALFHKVWKQLYEQVLVMDASATMNPIEKFDAMLDLIFDLYEQSPNIAIIFSHEQNILLRSHKDKFTPYFEKFIQVGEKIIRIGMRQKMVNRKLDIQMFRRFLLGGVNAMLQEWSVSANPAELKNICAQIKLFAKNGFLL